MPSKKEVAESLARAHRVADPDIVRIVQLVSGHEGDENEPVKLLEVNPSTSESGVLPIAFGAAPPAVPYPSIVVEVTPGEFAQITARALLLPEGWTLGDTLFAA
jgi:hypothetical protein